MDAVDNALEKAGEKRGQRQGLTGAERLGGGRGGLVVVKVVVVFVGGRECLFEGFLLVDGLVLKEGLCKVGRGGDNVVVVRRRLAAAASPAALVASCFVAVFGYPKPDVDA